VTPLAIGALLAAAAMVWVIAPIFTEMPETDRDRAQSKAADDAAESAIREWRESNK
jgi:hypothetical protein